MIGVKRGFTLVEVLVALAVFSVVMTVATNLFLTYQRVNRKSEALGELTASARFIVERIAREVREGTVDYNETPSHTKLSLRTTSNEMLVFEIGNDTMTMTQGIAPSEALTGTSVRVLDESEFTIVPAQDPFHWNENTNQFDANEQPRVTIFLSLDNNKPENDRDYIKYDVQTTISSRVYRR